LGLGKGNPYSGFQLYPRANVATVAKIPKSLDFQQAVVLPLSISTAAAGLYLEGNLGLDFPESDSSNQSISTLDQGSWTFIDKDKKKKQVLLLWGGSSSVGSSVIQLAAASGYDVVTTASPANYAYVKSLGAALVLDYHNPDIVPILVSLLKENGAQVVGAYDAIGSEMTVRQCAAVLHALGGGTIASVVSTPDDLPANVKVTRIGSGNIVSQEGGIVAKKVWGDFVPSALASGALKPEPQALVVGNGLYFVQGGLDQQRAGVSAKKIVVTL
jgi:NADPH:quinone reductase-like Zn-dependent oxidoreductase